MRSNPSDVSRKVECPDCGERVTIHVEDKECSECGINISERKREERNRLRSVKRDIAQVIRDSSIADLRDSRLQDNVARLDIRMEGPVTFDAMEVDGEELAERVEHQNGFQSLLSKIKENEEVLDIEEWYAEESNRGVSQLGSKYGMKPEFSFADEEDVTLLVGLASDVY